MAAYARLGVGYEPTAGVLDYMRTSPIERTALGIGIRLVDAQVNPDKGRAANHSKYWEWPTLPVAPSRLSSTAMRKAIYTVSASAVGVGKGCGSRSSWQNSMRTRGATSKE